MTTHNHYGPTCPYCSTAVPEYTAVCAGCAARKGYRSQTLGTVGAIMRVAVWCNTVGLVLFLMFFMFADPWLRADVLNGTSPVCMLDLRVQSHPVGLPELKSWNSESYRIADRGCDQVADLTVIEKAFMKFYSENPSRTRTTVAYEKERLRTVKVANRVPSWAGFLEAVIRSLLALLVGGATLRYIAYPLWNRFMGRLADPMWIKK